jgi:hypothetical protein
MNNEPVCMTGKISLAKIGHELYHLNQKLNAYQLHHKEEMPLI